MFPQLLFAWVCRPDYDIIRSRGQMLMENTESYTVEQRSDKKYKDTFFRTLFHDEERALELFNAIEGTNFPVGTPLQFYSQGDKSLTRRNNDLAVVIDNQLLAIKDHQGTLNPNMPLRLLPFATDILYTWLTDKKDLYKNRLVTIPTPKFYVLYNGKEKLINNVLRLSDAFRFENHDFSMELTVKIIDVNYGSGNEVLRKSPSLDGYAYLINCIRQSMNAGASRDKAIKAAVNQCINENILANFLKTHFQEVCDMFDYGITYEEEMEIKLEEAKEEAMEKGMIKGMEKGLVKGMEKGEEEGILKSAQKLLQKGISLQDVISMLDLSDNQIGEINKRFA